MRYLRLNLLIMSMLMLFVYSQATINFTTGTKIAIQANSNNNYITIDNSTSRLIANSTGTEEFWVINNSDGTLSFKSTRTAKYVTVEYGAAPYYLTASRTAIGPWEKFKVIDLGSNTFNLQSTYTNNYVCADIGYSQTNLVANRTVAGIWEKFILLPWSTPVTMNVGLFQINDFSYYNSLNPNTPVTLAPNLDVFGHTLYNNMKPRLNVAYPYVNINLNHDYLNSQVSTTLWSNPARTEFSQDDILFFSSHGGVGSMIVWEGSRDVTGTSKYYWFSPAIVPNGPPVYNGPFAGMPLALTPYWYGANYTTGQGSTKWVIFQTCNTLEESAPISDYYAGFNGLHAMFGYSSQASMYKSWMYSTNWECMIYGCKYHYRSDWCDYFSQRFVQQKMPMWESFWQSIQQCDGDWGGTGRDVASVYVAGFICGGTSLPDIIGRQPDASVLYVYWVDGSEEKINKVFNFQLPISTPEQKTTNGWHKVSSNPDWYWYPYTLYYINQVWGIPVYDSW